MLGGPLAPVMAEEQPERRATLRPEVAVHIRGWTGTGASEARRFGERVLALTCEYSRWLDLSRLSKIVLASDYRAAVAEVGSVDGTPNVATSNEFSEGAATALMTLEEGVLASVLVVWTPMVAKIFQPEESLERRTALQTFVHELVHVDDQAFLDRTFPGGAMAAVQRDDRHGALLLMVAPALAEYSATSRTAMIEPSTGFDFLQLLEKTMAGSVADVAARLRLYHVGALALDNFWAWVQERCRFLFQALGYAVGHADGVLKSERADEALKESFRKALAKVEAMTLGWLISETRAAILPIIEQPAWTGLDVFDPLISVGERLLNVFGICTRLEQEMLYVDVPAAGWEDL